MNGFTNLISRLILRCTGVDVAEGLVREERDADFLNMCVMTSHDVEEKNHSDVHKENQARGRGYSNYMHVA